MKTDYFLASQATVFRIWIMEDTSLSRKTKITLGRNSSQFYSKITKCINGNSWFQRILDITVFVQTVTESITRWVFFPVVKMPVGAPSSSDRLGWAPALLLSPDFCSRAFWEWWRDQVVHPVEALDWISGSSFNLAHSPAPLGILKVKQLMGTSVSVSVSLFFK